jgi:hypothetical protein
VAAGASNDIHFDYEATQLWTELQAAEYVEKRMNMFFRDEDITISI